MVYNGTWFQTLNGTIDAISYFTIWLLNVTVPVILFWCIHTSLIKNRSHLWQPCRSIYDYILFLCILRINVYIKIFSFFCGSFLKMHSFFTRVLNAAMCNAFPKNKLNIETKSWILPSWILSSWILPWVGYVFNNNLTLHFILTFKN